jgi:hypothetical protein
LLDAPLELAVAGAESARFDSDLRFPAHAAGSGTAPLIIQIKLFSAQERDIGICRWHECVGCKVRIFLHSS